MQLQHGRKRGPTVREPCGCAHDGYQWLEMCEPHWQEWSQAHTRALAEHAAEASRTSPAPTENLAVREQDTSWLAD
jgi:hypothetical protein